MSRIIVAQPRRLSRPVRFVILCLLLSPIFWSGWRFVQAVHHAFHVYDLNQQLWEASLEGRTALVESLLAQGASPNFADSGDTVLQNAVVSGNPKTVATLLRHGANVNGFSSEYSPLRIAREAPNAAIITLLKQAGAKE